MAEANKLGDSGAYLGPGTKIYGKLQFDGPATIEGEIEGEIIAHASVTMDASAAPGRFVSRRTASLSSSM